MHNPGLESQMIYIKKIAYNFFLVSHFNSVAIKKVSALYVKVISGFRN